MVYRLTIRFPRFQSTLPMRGETTRRKCSGSIFEISIHSPHAGRDENHARQQYPLSDFNPLSPCGERHTLTAENAALQQFQSTLPMRGETKNKSYRYYFWRFQSTLPMRGETKIGQHIEMPDDISIHSPHAGRDAYEPGSDDFDTISIHSPHAGRDK